MLATYFLAGYIGTFGILTEYSRFQVLHGNIATAMVPGWANVRGVPPCFSATPRLELLESMNSGPESTSRLVRKQGLFSGRVQGVGFRFKTCEVASRFEITGYVQNLDDGRVLVVAQGQKDELDQFFNSLSERLRRYIRSCNLQDRPATSEFKNFRIQYCNTE